MFYGPMSECNAEEVTNTLGIITRLCYLSVFQLVLVLVQLYWFGSLSYRLP